jgi:hypothetical protein
MNHLQPGEGSGSPAGVASARPDPWGEAVSSFLEDLLDNVEVGLVSGDEADGPEPDGTDRRWLRQVGPDGHVRRFVLRPRTDGDPSASPSEFPAELRDLPDSALRALARLTASSALWDPGFPSLRRAFHEIVIAEVIADRLHRRSANPIEVQSVAVTVADSLDYLEELAAGQLEGAPMTHGVVIAPSGTGATPLEPPISYPGPLRLLKRTPLLFDGTHAALLITSAGTALGGVTRDSLRRPPPGVASIGAFDEFPGLDGALTAAASAVFHGIGLYLRADRTIWIFDGGQPLFIRRANRWKSVAFESFIRLITHDTGTTDEVAQRLAHAALRLSMQGHGAVLGIARSSAALSDRLEDRDRYLAADSAEATADDALHRLLPPTEMTTPSSLARLARLDGATVIDPSGAVLAFGAIVRIRESHSEGARTAAARSLSESIDLALSVSQDGPITVFRRGARVLELL